MRGHCPSLSAQGGERHCLSLATPVSPVSTRTREEHSWIQHTHTHLSRQELKICFTLCTETMETQAEDSVQCVQTCVCFRDGKGSSLCMNTTSAESFWVACVHTVATHTVNQNTPQSYCTICHTRTQVYNTSQTWHQKESPLICIGFHEVFQMLLVR